MEREGKVLQAKDMHAKLTNKQRENQKLIKKMKKSKGYYTGADAGGSCVRP